MIQEIDQWKEEFKLYMMNKYGANESFTDIAVNQISSEFYNEDLVSIPIDEAVDTFMQQYNEEQSM